MQWWSEMGGLPELPALLAEYGRLAAQLPAADAGRVEQLHARLRELDEIIERLVADLGTSRI